MRGIVVLAGIGTSLAAGARIGVLLACTWQALVWLLQPPRYVLPSPLDVAAALLARPGYFLEHAGLTLAEIGAGFVAGASLGIATALAIAAIPRAGRLIWPVILVLQTLPVFVIAPLLVLWFGFGMTSKVVMTTLIIFFPITSAFVDGLRRIDPDILDAVAATDASRWQALALVRIPLALPSLVTGLRVAAPLAPLGAVIGEWVGAAGGLGFIMMQANARMQTDVVFAAMAILAALALALRGAVDWLAPRLTPWMAETEPHQPETEWNRS